MEDFYRVARMTAQLDPHLIDRLADVETATIGHFEPLGFLDAAIRPVFPAKIAGRAMTVAAPGRDGRIIYAAIDRLTPGDVLVIARVDQDDIACVGGGVTAAAKAKGAAGIIVDGPCTDPTEIVENGLPVWCNGVSAKTTSRTIAIGGALNFPIACGGAPILAGYCVLADDSGIFVAEASHMAAVTQKALKRQELSKAVRAHLAAGRSIFDFKQEHDQ
ncbi:RraA family protein [Pelagibacterium luteolum]|uniref:Putative 4-hydroxy-4-methyl-2-oxoglutarate aldolase n=1 Tax=Pelagibacterium luteolum TaxID=440168 RepID=A0A1G7ZYG1_9HYPH|nr:dimethylmenaquinone methyltransferase [Pelagibacterium luteolum]SDH13693.1 Regulator of RNase E activity RraA [Pelagibacterium luteolum]